MTTDFESSTPGAAFSVYEYLLLLFVKWLAAAAAAPSDATGIQKKGLDHIFHARNVPYYSR